MQWNPFKKREEGTFVVDRLRSRWEHRKTVTLIFGIAAVLGWAYIFVGSGIFDVQTIVLNDLATLEANEVTSDIYEILAEEGSMLWDSKNLLFLSEFELEVALKQRLFVENATVDKKYPHILLVTITERQNQLVLSNHDEYFLLDRTGFITEQLSPDRKKEIRTRLQSGQDATDVPVLTIQNVERAVLGEQFVSETRMRAWLDTFQALQKAGFGFRNAELEYPTSTKFVLNMYEPYHVYFDLLESMEPQIANFYTFMKVRNQAEPIYSYVDARIPGKIFYR